MTVDVRNEIVIDRPVDVVAAYAGDPSNAPEWYENIDSVTWLTDPPVQKGSKLFFVARFLGRLLEYSYVLVDFVPGERIVMRTEQGPFPMETTYSFVAEGEGSTRMTLRNRGEPEGFSKAMAPFMIPAIRSANRKDLDKLKQILEDGAEPEPQR